MIDMLREEGGGHIKVFAGGGVIIVADEIKQLQEYGVARIYSPSGGQRLGLQGMIKDMIERCEPEPGKAASVDIDTLEDDRLCLARLITALENAVLMDTQRDSLAQSADQKILPVPGWRYLGELARASHDGSDRHDISMH
jgi:methylmalonyl-CoA mutase